MGKKRQKRKDSNLSISYSEQDSRDSSYSLLNVSNKSTSEGSTIPKQLFVASVESAGCTSYANYLKSEWVDVVFLHPLVMKEYDIEDLVVIKGEGKTVLCTAYALLSLRKNVIVFPKGTSLFKCNELVSLCSFDRSVKNAEEIFITYNEDIQDSDQLQSQYVLRLLYNKYIYEGMVVKWKHFGRDYSCTIQGISCSLDISTLSLESNSNPEIPNFYIATYKTSVTNKPFKASQRTEMKTLSKFSAFDQIGGMEKQVQLICRYFEMFLKSNSLTGSVYCGTLLLTGPPGTGKSLLLQAIVDSFDIYSEKIKWPQLCGMYLTKGIIEVTEAFQRAKYRSPSIIILDDLNYVSSDNTGKFQNILKTLRQLLETLDVAKVFVIAATNDSGFDASVLQTSNRMMETIKIQIPSSLERTDILKKLLDSRNHNLNVEEIQKCASSAHGFTGRDLLEVIKDAQMIACKRECSDILDCSEFLDIVRSREHDKGKINYHDLEYSLKQKKPSIVTSDLKTKKVHWSDIGGMDHIKEKLKQLIELPLKFPEAFKHFNVTPSRGVLMYGPPGCCKTMIAKAMATECELNFISKTASELYDKYVGESEKAVRNLFAMAKAKSPCIIFLDEIDALVSERGSSSGSSGVGDRIVTTLLTEMDGVEELHGVIIIAATNRPDMLDDALVRNGRINHFIYVPLPDAKTREEILKINMKKRLLSEDFDFKVLAEKTEGYSGAEIVNLCNEAALLLLSECSHQLLQAETPTFTLSHFEKALSYTVPRTSKEIITFYEKFSAKH